MYVIYRIVNFRNGKVYVGKTSDLQNRKTHHFSNLRRNKHINIHLQRAFNKYGEDAFFFEILEKNLSVEEADEREKYWIKHFNAFAEGYNRTRGGEGKPDVGVRCTWNGIEYDSITAAARSISIHPSSMKARLKKGYTCDTDEPSKHRYFRHPIVWNGVEYPSIVAAERALGLKEGYLRWRISHGHTSDADLKGAIASPGIAIEWNGIKYKSIRQAAKALNINNKTMKHRIEREYSCDNDIVDRWGNKLYE